MRLDASAAASAEPATHLVVFRGQLSYAVFPGGVVLRVGFDSFAAHRRKSVVVVVVVVVVAFRALFNDPRGIRFISWCTRILQHS